MTLSWADWIIIAAYFLASIAIGLYYAEPGGGPLAHRLFIVAAGLLFALIARNLRADKTFQPETVDSVARTA